MNHKFRKLISHLIWVSLFFSISHVAYAGNYALSFDGVDDYVEITGYQGVTGANARTVEAWIKTTSLDVPIISWGGLDANGHRWGFRVNRTYNGALGAIQLATKGGNLIGTTPVNDGQWHHIACTFSNDGTPNITDVKLYVDGILQGMSTFTSGIINTASGIDVRIGKDLKAFNEYFFKGKMAEVRIWNRALSATEIQANMSAVLTGSESGLVTYHRFNEGSGTTAYDKTSNGYDGTLYGYPLWMRDTSYSLPLEDGSANQILQTNGNGNISWVNLPTINDYNNLINSPMLIVKNVAELLDAQTKINTGTATTVRIKPNVYILTNTFHINKSNVSIIGEHGAKLVLANHVNKPVIAIGSQEETTSYVIENIKLSGIEIDGNKENQSSEFDVNKPWIRNNGIDVRAVNRLTVENVISNNNRSGGLVISWGSSDVHVVNSEFDSNFFDGVAYYTSKRIYTSNSSMKENNGAGISLDNDITDSIFSNCILDSNKDVGIFARNAKELRFNNCVIKNSGNWAVFLGHDDNNQGVHDIMFSNCQILNNVGGILMSSTSEAQSSFNSVISSVFRGNEQGGNQNIKTEGSRIWESANIMME